MTPLVSRAAFWRRIMLALIACPGYQWGGRSLAGMDCSGLPVWALWEASGHTIDWRGKNTDALWTTCPRVSEADAQACDVALYFGAFSTGPDDVSHAMVLTPFGQCVGMAHGGKADVDPFASKAAGKVIQVCDLHYRPDFAGIVRLPLT